MHYIFQWQRVCLLFYRLSHRRSTWQVLLTSALLLFALALIIQHGLGLAPCVLCIYQRLALLGLCIAAGVALCALHRLFVRISAVLVWLVSATWGLLLSWQQVQYQYHPRWLTSCPFRTHFPPWLLLDNWFPVLFRAYGTCNQLAGQWLGLGLPHCMVLLFAVYLLIAALIFISQWMVCTGVAHGK